MFPATPNAQEAFVREWYERLPALRSAEYATSFPYWWGIYIGVETIPTPEEAQSQNRWRGQEARAYVEGVNLGTLWTQLQLL